MYVVMVFMYRVHLIMIPVCLPSANEDRILQNHKESTWDVSQNGLASRNWVFRFGMYVDFVYWQYIYGQWISLGNILLVNCSIELELSSRPSL